MTVSILPQLPELRPPHRHPALHPPPVHRLNPAANGTVEFGRGTISDGSTKNVFWAEWIDVAEYGNNSARQEFQMLIIEESDGATIEFRYVDLTNAGSTTNSVFEAAADPTDSNNTVRIPDSNGDPSASELLSGKSGGSTGIWAYSVADSGSPSPAPTPTPTPTPINTIQPNPPWGLDRIDQRFLPLDNLRCGGQRFRGDGVRDRYRH